MSSAGNITKPEKPEVKQVHSRDPNLAIRQRGVRLREKMASRKFIFSVALCIGVAALLVTGYVPAEIFKDVISIVIIGYIGGNVAEKFSGTKE